MDERLCAFVEMEFSQQIVETRQGSDHPIERFEVRRVYHEFLVFIRSCVFINFSFPPKTSFFRAFFLLLFPARSALASDLSSTIRI